VSRTDVFRDGRVHVQARKCGTCIYRPGNLMKLDTGRVAQMQADAIEGEGVIPCHQTIEAYTGEAGAESVCRGFFDVAKHEGLLAVAERLGIVEFTAIDNSA
jgi:hypothetical protein